MDDLTKSTAVCGAVSEACERPKRLSRPTRWMLTGASVVLVLGLTITAVQIGPKLALISEIKRMGGEVGTAPELPAWLASDSITQWPYPIGRVTRIYLGHTDADDEFVRRLGVFSDLEKIVVGNTRITPASLMHLDQFKELKGLDIGY